MIFLSSRYSIKLFVFLFDDFLNGNPSTWLYSIRLTLQGAFLQKQELRKANALKINYSTRKGEY